MATASLSSRVSDAQIKCNRAVAKQRDRNRAAEELRRNGIAVSKDWQEDDATLPALNVRDIGKTDFVSHPKASEMTQADICNIEPVSVFAIREQLIDLIAKIGRRQARQTLSDWLSGASDDWPPSDIRWTLSPHLLRRLSELAREPK